MFENPAKLLQNNIVKKILTGLVIILGGVSLTFAETQPLLPASFVEVNNGNITENTLLASDEGGIFIEFSKATKFVDTEAKINFTGEILPPQKIELDWDRPQKLMKELVTFELVSNTGADISFIDRFDKRTRKNLFREQLLNPDGLKKSAWVRLVYSLDKDSIKRPKLWEWEGENGGWKRRGGTIIENDDKSRVFTVILRRTGVYTIFDEDPAPDHFADEYEVYPKRPYTGPYAENPAKNNDGNNLINENPADFSITTGNNDNPENQNIAGFHSAGTPPTIDDNIEIPSVQDPQEITVLQELSKKITENPAKLKSNPEMEKKANELVDLLKKRALKKKEISTISADLNNVSLSLSRSTDENEKKNLEKTFLDLQTKLYQKQKEDKELGDKILVLKKEVDDFFAGISSESLSANSFNSETASPNTLNTGDVANEEPYIPENATLIKSGADEPQNISWQFPIFLIICFGLLGLGIWSSKKQNI